MSAKPPKASPITVNLKSARSKAAWIFQSLQRDRAAIQALITQLETLDDGYELAIWEMEQAVTHLNNAEIGKL
jgi:hypothetical protein